MGTTYKAQSLYIFLENIDRQQKLSLQAWTDKQKDVEVKRRECLSSMVAVFPKVGLLPYCLLGRSGGISPVNRDRNQDMSQWGYGV
jgi:hypothetical protein